MFTRSNTDLPRNRVLQTSTSKALLNRPTMDSKTKSNISLKGTINSTKKRVPLIPKVETNTSTLSSRRKLPLGTKNEPNGCNTGAKLTADKAKLAKTEASTSNVKTKQKIISVIERKGGLKDKVDLNTKKKLEYINKIKEINTQIKSAEDEITTLNSSTVKEQCERISQEVDVERQKFEELLKCFETAKSSCNIIKTNVDNLSEKIENENKIIDELECKIKQNNASIMKFESILPNLESQRIKNEKMLENLTEEIKHHQQVIHQVFQDNTSLHNDIYNLKGNIQVICKVRPLLGNEDKESQYSIIYVDECTMSVGKTNMSQSLVNSKCKLARKEFTFDKIYLPIVSANQLFEEASSFVHSAIEGQSVCILLYGPKNSGKTYTLEGPENSPEEGLLYLMADYIFETINNMKIMGWHHKIVVQYTEVNQKETKEICKRDILQPEDLIESYYCAKKGRNRNSLSFVMQIQIDGFNSNLSRSLSGVINIVENSVEKDISQSTLQKSIQGLAQNIKENPVYEDSPLTNMLLSNLNENSKILIILHITPTANNYSECLETMKFGNEVVACRFKNSKKHKN